ncbi:MAG: mechanosensitive ion channel [Planctomycetes bacterium]|nr:mechanosensitive ion channel [Planctomycetota bacterium]
MAQAGDDVNAEAVIDMGFQMHTDRKLWLRLLFALVLLLPSAAAGQQPQESATGEAQTQPAAVTQPAVPQPSLSASELQSQLKQVQEAADLAEETKSKAVGLYTQAIQQLEIAEQWAAKAIEYEADRQKAPETLSAIQAELTTPLGEPTPDVPAEATRADLEQRLRQVQSDLEAEKKIFADWERERDRRTARRKEIPELLTAAKSRQQTLAETPTSPEAEQSAVVRLAQQALNQARRLAVEREIEAYNSELLSYDARRDLLQARLDRSARRIGHFEKLLAAWQKLAQEKARKESELALREAREQLKRAHPAIRPLAEEREQLALRAKELQAESKEVDALVTESEALLTQMNQDFDKITRRVNATGLTNAIGQLLRKHRGSLPSLRRFERNLRQRKDRISAVQLAMMELEDRRSELMNVDAIVAAIRASIDAGTSEEQRTMIRQAAEEAIVTLRADTDSLVKDYDRLFDKLVDLDSKERDLVETIERFGEYVDEKVLWIKSGTLPAGADIRYGQEALAWLLDPVGWGAVIRSVGGTLRANPGPTVAGLVLLVVIWLASPRLLRLVREAGETVTKPAKDSMGRTMGVLFATAGLAVRWPVTLWLAGWVIASPYDATDFSKAVASGLNATAVIVLTLQSLRQLARHNGLAEKHFRWNARSLKLLKRHIAWLTSALVPTFFIFATLEAQTIESAKDSLGRLTFVVAFLAIALFVQRVLRPAGRILGPVLQRQPGSSLYRLRHIWYLIALTLPASLVIAAVSGYYYTSLYLGTRFIETVWLLLGLVVLRALVERWLLLQTRRRAIAEARERAALRRQQKEGESGTPPEQEVVPAPENKLDVAAISKQTLQLVRTTLIVVGFVALWGIWAEALPALGVFRGVTLWSVTQQASETVPTADGGTQVNEYTKTIPITLANLGLAGLVALITIVAVKNIPGLLQITILQRLPIDAGGRFAATAITRYVLTLVGTIVAFGQIGIGWSNVQWLIAAMTVGLGFGLQEIFANLVSGLMLLFERPIRIGDVVTVADISGTVTRIRTRATTIMGWDRKELIIPNKEFITGKVVNWTLSDSTLRITMPVGIAYGSDTQLAREVLTRIVREHPNVLADPAPRILFTGFGESSLDFEARVYIGAIDHYLSTLDEINNAIDQEFRKAGIEIAFPQRDIHVRSIRDALPIADERRTDAGAVALAGEAGSEITPRADER